MLAPVIPAKLLLTRSMFPTDLHVHIYFSRINGGLARLARTLKLGSARLPELEPTLTLNILRDLLQDWQRRVDAVASLDKGARRSFHGRP